MDLFLTTHIDILEEQNHMPVYKKCVSSSPGVVLKLATDSFYQFEFNFWPPKNLKCLFFNRKFVKVYTLYPDDDHISYRVFWDSRHIEVSDSQSSYSKLKIFLVFEDNTKLQLVFRVKYYDRHIRSCFDLFTWWCRQKKLRLITVDSRIESSIDFTHYYYLPVDQCFM